MRLEGEKQRKKTSPPRSRSRNVWPCRSHVSAAVSSTTPVTSKGSQADSNESPPVAVASDVGQEDVVFQDLAVRIAFLRRAGPCNEADGYQWTVWGGLELPPPSPDRWYSSFALMPGRARGIGRRESASECWPGGRGTWCWLSENWTRFS
jgi:hypothetical protein